MTSNAAFLVGVVYGVVLRWLWLKAAELRAAPAERLWDQPEPDAEHLARRGPDVVHVFSRGRRR